MFQQEGMLKQHEMLVWEDVWTSEENVKTQWNIQVRTGFHYMLLFVFNKWVRALGVGYFSWKDSFRRGGLSSSWAVRPLVTHANPAIPPLLPHSYCKFYFRLCGTRTEMCFSQPRAWHNALANLPAGDEFSLESHCQQLLFSSRPTGVQCQSKLDHQHIW